MNILKKMLLKIPYIEQLYKDVQIYKKGYPPGHYYSPIVSVEEITENAAKIFKAALDLPGISLDADGQIKLLRELKTYYSSVPYLDKNVEGLRYYFNNNTFEYSDAIFLHMLIRYLKPNRIIEIGSGFSSAVMLDTNEFFFKNTIHLTFIEPYSERLIKLMKPMDKDAVQLIEQNLQNVNLDLFRTLTPGDILFVDSTHVCKTGSDVNMILFNILPMLPKGVIIHFHDIFYPFEYPKEWVLGWSGFGWNEIYLLRAYLTNNPEYRIILFNTYLEKVHEEWFLKNMPACLIDKGGSLWLRKV